MKSLDNKNHTWYSFIRENARKYASHVPHASNVIDDFAINRERQSMECAPLATVRLDPPLPVQPTDIYLTYVGMIPNYLGYIPGASFRYGKTFGADTKNVKEWLRKDSTL